MKKTIRIIVNNKKEYEEYAKILLERGFEPIGTRLFEDNKSYIRIYINKII